MAAELCQRYHEMKERVKAIPVHDYTVQVELKCSLCYEYA